MSEILNQFRDEELPASTVDIQRAVREGRRQRTRSRLAVGGAVVAVVAAAASAPLWLSPQPSPPPVGFPTPTCEGTPPPRAASPTWAYFDPLIAEIDASGVTGYRVAATVTSTYWQQAELVGVTDVYVILFATGGEPHSLVDETIPVDPAAGEPAEPVRGAPAYWLTPSDPTALAWQWTPGAWAVVHVVPPGPDQTRTPMDQDDLRAIATQVAQQLQLGVGTPVTAPFSLPVPDCLYPALALFASDSSGSVPAFFGLGFDRIGAAPPTRAGGYVPQLWVNAYASVTADDLPVGTTGYRDVFGYRAYQTNQRAEGRDSYSLWVMDVSGFAVEIEPRFMTGPPAQRLDYAADIFGTLTIYPDAATDPTAWGDPITP